MLKISANVQSLEITKASQSDARALASQSGETHREHSTPFNGLHGFSVLQLRHLEDSRPKALRVVPHFAKEFWQTEQFNFGGLKAKGLEDCKGFASYALSQSTRYL